MYIYETNRNSIKKIAFSAKQSSWSRNVPKQLDELACTKDAYTLFMLLYTNLARFARNGMVMAQDKNHANWSNLPGRSQEAHLEVTNWPPNLDYWTNKECGNIRHPRRDRRLRFRRPWTIRAATSWDSELRNFQPWRRGDADGVAGDAT